MCLLYFFQVLYFFQAEKQVSITFLTFSSQTLFLRTSKWRAPRPLEDGVAGGGDFLPQLFSTSLSLSSLSISSLSSLSIYLLSISSLSLYLLSIFGWRRLVAVRPPLTNMSTWLGGFAISAKRFLQREQTNLTSERSRGTRSDSLSAGAALALKHTTSCVPNSSFSRPSSG